jgi:hypothetical protein
MYLKNHVIPNNILVQAFQDLNELKEVDAIEQKIQRETASLFWINVSDFKSIYLYLSIRFSSFIFNCSYCLVGSK